MKKKKKDSTNIYNYIRIMRIIQLTGCCVALLPLHQLCTRITNPTSIKCYEAQSSAHEHTHNKSNQYKVL